MNPETVTETNGATQQDSPPKKAWVNFNGDVLGIGKFLGHLGLSKLPVPMRYCLATNLLLAMLIALMLTMGIKKDGFPSATDLRTGFILFFIIFICGIWLYNKEKAK